MAYKTTFLNTMNISKEAKESASVGDQQLADLMANPEYLRHSSSVINEALKEGFDVLQLPNGDIVTTGTKTIVNTFVWDAAKGKLTKAKAGSDKPRAKRAAKVEAFDEEDAE
ncbi:MAG: DUF2671 domain-containing protein [Alphaproteobacteria bacterium]|nr:DUF2671 domain-containing protein [Alphaproteobacteria bacterium]